MSVSGILSSSLSSYNVQNLQSNRQQFQQEFQQLGQDLQSGNLSAAQTDFATLQQKSPQASSSSQSTNSITQAFNQLGTDLQAGNTTAAQQDYANIQQDAQSQVPRCITTTIIMAAVASKTKSARCSSSWDRICSPAKCRPRSRPMAHCRLICSSLQLRPRRHPPVPAVFRSARS